jgi:F420-0:gamma-glutamyl ligase
VDVQRDLLELVGVLVAVVFAEQELRTAREGDPYVSLGPAAITAISDVQRRVLDY